MNNGNAVEPFEWGKDDITTAIVINELFCYIHPRHGHIIKKSYATPAHIIEGRPPEAHEGRQALIDQRKRQIEVYNTRVTAIGSLPIADWWWEPPGDPPGRYNPDSSPEDLELYRKCGGRDWH